MRPALPSSYPNAPVMVAYGQHLSMRNVHPATLDLVTVDLVPMRAPVARISLLSAMAKPQAAPIPSPPELQPSKKQAKESLWDKLLQWL